MTVVPKIVQAHSIRVIDTHTGGEPTRVVVRGGPNLGEGSMAVRRDRFALQFDSWRSAIACEPRGSDVMVGALITEPERADSLAGVIFFNNVGFLGMCGHGTIGVAVALEHLGRIRSGRHALDTPAGQVWFELLGEGRVRIENVPSYRYRANIQVALENNRLVSGDIAWGGNWFFLCDDHELTIEPSNIAPLIRLASEIRKQLQVQGITGENGAEIDHIELIGRSSEKTADARNFVLCPGGAYDRSPCGTGTSAKVACLAADGLLSPSAIWRQASVIGSQFEATYDFVGDPVEMQVRVALTGSAYVIAEADLILDSRDPFCMGIRL